MTKYILIFLLLATFTFAQDMHFKGKVTIDSLVTTILVADTSSDNITTSDLIAGTDSIHYGEDSIVVSHGVGSTPQFVVIQLVSDGFGFQTWVSGINSLTFYVRRSDTGLKTITSSIQFKWMAYK
jgi:hypothetical protein